ncbi:hypothetical protein IGM04_002761 [Enterococcus sp. DIV2385]|nr:hypothetical protein A5830_002797 [Enterococcus faecalis]
MCLKMFNTFTPTSGEEKKGGIKIYATLFLYFKHIIFSIFNLPFGGPTGI